MMVSETILVVIMCVLCLLLSVALLVIFKLKADKDDLEVSNYSKTLEINRLRSRLEKNYPDWLKSIIK